MQLEIEGSTQETQRNRYSGLDLSIGYPLFKRHNYTIDMRCWILETEQKDIETYINIGRKSG